MKGTFLLEMPVSHRHQFGVMMAKEICAVTADQIQHRDQTIVAALPQVVPFSAFVDRIQTDGLQQWDQSRSAEMLIPFYIVRCRIEGPLGRAQ